MVRAVVLERHLDGCLCGPVEFDGAQALRGREE
jgi:hypothetical protein